MNSIVKYFMERNKVIVQYVYDRFGYRYGCVVAIGPGRLGWSMVNHSEDYEYKQVKPWQLPAIQRLKNILTAEDFPRIMLQSPAYRAWINKDGLIRIPMFNRHRALEEAINKALRSQIFITESREEGLTFVGTLPNDKEMMDTLIYVQDRSKRAKWPDQE
jgi:hypothetical protein